MIVSSLGEKSHSPKPLSSVQSPNEIDASTRIVVQLHLSTRIGTILLELQSRIVASTTIRRTQYTAYFLCAINAMVSEDAIR